jgi:hypothetical protein
MKWEIPPLQDPNSNDCEKFAVAYICRLLGFNTDWKDVKEWVDKERRVVDLYPYFVHGIQPEWSWWDVGKNPLPKGVSKVYLPSYSRHEQFKDFIFENLNKGCVGYASTFHVDWIGHALVLLEADEEGVLFADSARGLVKDTWDKFINPLGKEHRYVSRVQTWYKIG